ncbi:MAG: hypothetical protein ACE5E6_11525 [Phycisphaerae bacterium]
MVRKHRYMFRLMLGSAAAVLTAGLASAAPQGDADRAPAYAVDDGAVDFALSHAALDAIGWRIVSDDVAPAGDGVAYVSVVVDPDAKFRMVAEDDGVAYRPDGSLQTRGAVALQHDDTTMRVGDFALRVGDDGAWVVFDMLGTQRPAFELSAVVADFVPDARVFLLSADVLLSDVWAAEFGIPEAAGALLGTVTAEARMAASDAPAGAGAFEAAPRGGVVAGGGEGPDVIVGDLPAAQWFANINGISAYSVATTSCNIGTVPLLWQQNNNKHPVIGQSLYRISDLRIEQVGMSFLKHGFCALQLNVCPPCTPTGGGCEQSLGVGCSDPYSTGLNGQQSLLGPRWQVNPTTGVFPYPWSAPPVENGLSRRLQVHNEDLDPALNAGALYFVEGQYVTQDDAAAGNQDNNASYRPATVTENGQGNFIVTVTGATVQMQPAILAWPESNSSAQAMPIDVPGDRRFWIAWSVRGPLAGVFHYEYAVFNLNSDRAAGTFTVPMGPGASAFNVGFHAVERHSGSPYSNAPWSVTVDDAGITWSTTPFAQDANASALRWGAMYNFWFDSESEPATMDGSLGLFKPGMPEAMTISIDGPAGMENVAIVSSDPPDGAIDARQPSEPSGENVDGWDTIDLVFDGDTAGVTAADLAVSQSDGGQPPAIVNVTSNGSTLTVAFDQPVNTLVWTTVEHIASGTSIRLGYLPADVNNDRLSNANDILALIDALNGVGDPLAMYQTDLDRSDMANASDILRGIDLLNGAGDYIVYNGASLPE